MGACPVNCLMHERLPRGLQYARMLAREFAICTGELPCGLRGARALAWRVYKMHGRLPGGLQGMTREICIKVRGGIFGILQIKDTMSRLHVETNLMLGESKRVCLHRRLPNHYSLSLHAKCSCHFVVELPKVP
ncbi:hypothetical protein CRG98_000303 [Punica granatum]|uniref:Uncharacterized protein n=1 Tax=Punica granatum TaxID=22663 RepID=A0A2I0LF34_PUNGR|nr:hypothetical protein CRG98_000303 [Punica granatum]